MSPKLFPLVLQDTLKKVNWANRGININWDYLYHLKFADDIVAESKEEHTTLIKIVMIPLN